jgi:hypothetical protein
MAWVTPTNAVTGDVLTASRWNQDVVANSVEVAPFFGAWTSWTPTVYQNGARTSTNTLSRYLKVGRLVIVTANVTITNAGTSGNQIVWTLPSTPANPTNGGIVGTWMYIRTTGVRYQGSFNLNSAFGAAIVTQQDGTGNQLGIDTAFATANGDVLMFSGMYEAAT